jgi:flagellar basal-body rod modification protein FlgD
MIDSIGGGTAQQQSASEASQATQATLGQEEFLNILLTQLTFQDPLKPLDNQEFIAQMAQFTNLEQTRQLSESSDTLLTVQSATQAIGIIGKTVSVVTDSGLETGTVTTVAFQQGIPELSLQLTGGGALTNIRLADVQLVRN